MPTICKRPRSLSWWSTQMFDRQKALEEGRQLLERSKTCSRCGRALRAGEPVWRNGGRMPTCKGCMRWNRFAIYSTGPCDTCGRTVHFMQGREWRRHYFCSQGCKLLYQHAKARQRRAEARGATQVCVGCGEHFEPTRADSRFCSGACRQKAYRQRVTAGERAVGGTFGKRNGGARKRKRKRALRLSNLPPSGTFAKRNGGGVTDSKPVVIHRFTNVTRKRKPVTDSNCHINHKIESRNADG